MITTLPYNPIEHIGKVCTVKYSDDSVRVTLYTNWHKNGNSWEGERYTTNTLYDPDVYLKGLILDNFEEWVDKAKAEERDQLDEYSKKESLDKADAVLARLINDSAIRSASTPDVIKLSPILEEWRQGQYVVGDVRMYKGFPRKCILTHDSSLDPNWNPDAPTLWVTLHGTTMDTALPFKAESHNPYKKGEWVIMANGDYYSCIGSSTVYSPYDYPADWKKEMR